MVEFDVGKCGTNTKAATKKTLDEWLADEGAHRDRPAESWADDFIWETSVDDSKVF